MINKRKVVLVGTGFVGMSAAYSLIKVVLMKWF